MEDTVMAIFRDGVVEGVGVRVLVPVGVDVAQELQIGVMRSVGERTMSGAVAAPGTITPERK